MEKLNEKHQDLWQRPKKKVTLEDPCWYYDDPVGRDPLNNMMETLEINAELSQVYSNHLIRVTAITKLDQNNIKSGHIQAVSGHKSEATIRTYSKFCPANEKREMYNIFDLERTPAPPIKKLNRPPLQQYLFLTTK